MSYSSFLRHRAQDLRWSLGDAAWKTRVRTGKVVGYMQKQVPEHPVVWTAACVTVGVLFGVVAALHVRPTRDGWR